MRQIEIMFRELEREKELAEKYKKKTAVKQKKDVIEIEETETEETETETEETETEETEETEIEL